jgi:hypothetical protein
MDSPQDAAALPAAGFPIRKSTDRSLVSGSPWLIAATHVLRRLLEPRHPPHALSSLVTLNSGLPSRSSSGNRIRGRDPNPSEIRTPQDLAVRCSSYLPFVFGCQSASAAAGTRATGPGLEFPAFDLVELIGVEPTTSSLQSWRSTN